jgi:hypothetical protein
MDADGSPEYAMIWSGWDIKWGPPICALRVLGLRKSDNAFGGWPMASSRDHKDVTDPNTWKCTEQRNRHDQLGRAVHLAGYPTATSQPDNKTPEAHLRMKKRMGERDGTGANRTAITDLQVLARAAFGMPQSCSTAKTDTREGYRLNPRFSLWLMGYPEEWGYCGERAMQSCRK